MAGIFAAAGIGGRVLGFVFSGPGVATIGATVLLASCGVQTLRLDMANDALAKARAALIDPAAKPKATWQAEEMRDRADLATCQANEITLNGAITVQNASISAQAHADSAALSRSEAVIRQAQSTSAATAKALDALGRPIAGATPAERCADVDKMFLETLK